MGNKTRAALLAVGATGMVFDYAGATAPEGFLLCYGQAVSHATYSRLYDVIGTTYGAGDGSTTFNVPDCRGRVIAGKDNMGGTAASRLTNAGTGNSGINASTLGAAGGVDRYALATTEMPSHVHTANATNGFWGDIGGRYVANASGSVINLNNFPSTDATGGGQAHQNVQPTIVMNKIIMI